MTSRRGRDLAGNEMTEAPPPFAFATAGRPRRPDRRTAPRTSRWRGRSAHLLHPDGHRGGGGRAAHRPDPPRAALERELLEIVPTEPLRPDTEYEVGSATTRRCGRGRARGGVHQLQHRVAGARASALVPADGVDGIAPTIAIAVIFDRPIDPAARRRGAAASARRRRHARVVAVPAMSRTRATPAGCCASRRRDRCRRTRRSTSSSRRTSPPRRRRRPGAAACRGASPPARRRHALEPGHVPDRSGRRGERVGHEPRRHAASTRSRRAGAGPRLRGRARRQLLRGRRRPPPGVSACRRRRPPGHRPSEGFGSSTRRTRRTAGGSPSAAPMRRRAPGSASGSGRRRRRPAPIELPRSEPVARPERLRRRGCGRAAARASLLARRRWRWPSWTSAGARRHRSSCRPDSVTRAVRAAGAAGMAARRSGVLLSGRPLDAGGRGDRSAAPVEPLVPGRRRRSTARALRDRTSRRRRSATGGRAGRVAADGTIAYLRTRTDSCASPTSRTTPGRSRSLLGGARHRRRAFAPGEEAMVVVVVPAEGSAAEGIERVDLGAASATSLATTAGAALAALTRRSRPVRARIRAPSLAGT